MGISSEGGSRLDSKPLDLPRPPVRSVTGLKWGLIVIAIFSTNFLFALDNTIVANIQPAIIRDLGEINKLPWISVGFPLAAASTNFVWGRFYSLFDVKRLYIVSIVVFQTGSAVCGAAKSLDMLIAGRVLGGLGCQGMYIGVMTFIGSLTTTQEKPIYISLGGIVWGLGTVLGPVIGAAFTSSAATWRWSFYINLCVGAIFAPVYVWLLPSIRFTNGRSMMQRVSSLDFLGIALLIVAIPLGILAIDLGGIIYPWSSGIVIAFFIISGVLLILLSVQQYAKVFTSSDTRVIPLQFFRSRELMILCLQTTGATAAGLIPVFFLPLYFQFSIGTTPLRTAVYLLPLIVFLVVSCFFTGAMVSKFGWYMPWFTFAGVCSIAGSALMYTVHGGTHSANVYGYSILLGVGAGSAMQLPFSVSQAKVKPQELALANGLISQAQVGGLSLSLAVANSIFLNRAFAQVSHILPNASQTQIQALVNGVSGSALKGLPSAQHDLVLDAVVEAIRNVYLVVLVLGILTTLSSLLLKGERLLASAQETRVSD